MRAIASYGDFGPSATAAHSRPNETCRRATCRGQTPTCPDRACPEPAGHVDTFAAVDAAALEQEARAAIAAAATPHELDELRVRYLGRKSELKQALRQVRDRESGMALNAARETLESTIEARQAELDRAELERSLAEDAVDVTLPGELLERLEGLPPRPQRRGHLHLITQIRREVEDIFLGMGYEVV